MSIISIFSSIFCNEEPVITGLISNMGYPLFRDSDIISIASDMSGIPQGKMERVFSAKTSVFNQFTHERERSIAYIKLALAEAFERADLIIEGFISHLIPRELSHVLNICLIADLKSRIDTAVNEQCIAEDEALRLIKKKDEDRATWVSSILNKTDPWDASLYDILIPTDKIQVEAVIDLIEKNANSNAVKSSEESRQAVSDFQLAAQVEVSLLREGHNVLVRASNGKITLTIEKHVLMLSRLEEELKMIADQTPGVKMIDTRMGPDFHRAATYKKFQLDMPSKVLLVDDEREFVQTLSERLLMREMGSVVAYDGESALELIAEDEPEVMILDLRMPGIDGIEVLKRVKHAHPKVEVIILTGHGSEADRNTCMQLGAFAYLQKPVDIDQLSVTIKQADEKTRNANKNQT